MRPGTTSALQRNTYPRSLAAETEAPLHGACPPLVLTRWPVTRTLYGFSEPIGRPEVQKFVGSLVGMGATKGVFVTTSTFSGEAIQYAQHLSQRVILIDGQRLAELMVEHSVGVQLNRVVEFKQIDENYFDE